jgi:hypothetical protein
MKQDNHGKKPQANQLVIYGALLVFFSFMPAKVPLTRALNIICSLGGAGLIIAGTVQEHNQRKNK